VARAICDQESLPLEMEFLHSTFNSLATVPGKCALNPPHIEDTPREKLTLLAFLHIVEPTFNHTSRVLSRCNIKNCIPPAYKGHNLLHQVKDELSLSSL